MGVCIEQIDEQIGDINESEEETRHSGMPSLTFKNPEEWMGTVDKITKNIEKYWKPNINHAIKMKRDISGYGHITERISPYANITSLKKHTRQSNLTDFFKPAWYFFDIPILVLCDLLC